MSPAVRSAPIRGRARVARGLAASVVCLLLSLAGHLGTGGAHPDIALVALLGLPLTALFVLLADRRRGAPAILALVGGSQLAMHGLLQRFGTEPVTMPGHALMSPGPTAGMAGMPEMTGAAGMNPLLMTGAHLLAALVAAVMLAGAESALGTVSALLGRALPSITLLTATAVPECPSSVARLPDCPPPARPKDTLGRRFYLLRGPPTVAPRPSAGC